MAPRYVTEDDVGKAVESDEDDVNIIDEEDIDSDDIFNDDMFGEELDDDIDDYDEN